MRVPAYTSKPIAFAFALLLLAAAYVAYQTYNPGVPPAEVNLTVTASDVGYDPATIKVWQGQTVHLTFRNASSTMVHELRLRDLGVETKAGPGMGNTQTFVASVVGTHKITCNIPGHQGMVGEFIVQ